MKQLSEHNDMFQKWSIYANRVTTKSSTQDLDFEQTLCRSNGMIMPNFPLDCIPYSVESNLS